MGITMKTLASIMLPILRSFLVILVILTLLYSFVGVCKTCSTKHKNEVSLGNQIEVEITGTGTFYVKKMHIIHTN